MREERGKCEVKDEWSAGSSWFCIPTFLSKPHGWGTTHEKVTYFRSRRTIVVGLAQMWCRSPAPDSHAQSETKKLLFPLKTSYR